MSEWASFNCLFFFKLAWYICHIVTSLRLLVITFVYFLNTSGIFTCFVQAEPFDHWLTVIVNIWGLFI